MLVNLGVLTILSLCFGFLLTMVPDLEGKKQSEAELRYFSGFFWSLGAGIFGLYLRYIEPSLSILSIFVANAGFTAAGIFLYRGFCQRRSLQNVLTSDRFIIGYVLAYFLTIVWFTLVAPSLMIRSAVVFGGFSFWFLNCVIVANKQINDFNKGERVARWSVNVTLFSVSVLLPVMFYFVPDEDVFYSQLIFIILILETFVFGGIYISRLYDIVESHYAESVTDPLTGLYNRRFLYMQAEQQLAAAQRHDFPVSVVLCDIDHFKRINDSFGHEAGDAAIKHFSSC
ncbi:MAG: GGDEF domain-containing protein, partial [Pseudomonadales bacterium]|nr:GGDEF domain-containing protein [Pseudomonadales bacterium]